MPGTGDNPDDDDSGSLIYWLRYKVWKVRGWQILIAVLGFGLILGHFA